jgi:hypothetical protein
VAEGWPRGGHEGKRKKLVLELVDEFITLQRLN